MTLDEIIQIRDPGLWLVWRMSQSLETMQGILQQMSVGQTQIINTGGKILSALDDLAAAVDESVAAMNHAAETIQQHAGDNPAMAAAAARLRTAASALEDIDPAEVAPPATDTGGGATAP